VAGFRAGAAEAADLLSLSAAENPLRGVLGEQQTTCPKKVRTRAQFLLLAALAVTLDAHELNEVLAEGRALADSLAAEDQQLPSTG
jgi:hypothetical protein